ncbi:unnamed protein product [Camellia sinensis]
MAVRFVLERTVKIKTGYVNPKLGFWFAAALSNPSCIPLCRVLTVAKIATQLLAYDIIVPRLGSRHPLAGGSALYDKPLDHPEILRIARIASFDCYKGGVYKPPRFLHGLDVMKLSDELDLVNHPLVECHVILGCVIYRLLDAHKHITRPPARVIFPKKICIVMEIKKIITNNEGDAFNQDSVEIGDLKPDPALWHEDNGRKAWENRRQDPPVKKIAKLEAECQRLHGLVRKKLPGPAALAQMKLEVENLGRDYGETRVRRSLLKPPSPHPPQLPDFSLDSVPKFYKENDFLTEHLLAMSEETKMLKKALAMCTSELQASRNICAKTVSKLQILESQLHANNQQKSPSKSSLQIPTEGSLSQNAISPPSFTSMSENGNDNERSWAGSWAATSISEISHFKGKNNEKSNKAEKENHLERMDDFLEMEKLASHDSNGAISGSDISNNMRSEMANQDTTINPHFHSKEQPELDSLANHESNSELPVPDPQPDIDPLPLMKFQMQISMLFESKDADIKKILDDVRCVMQETQDSLHHHTMGCVFVESHCPDAIFDRQACFEGTEGTEEKEMSLSKDSAINEELVAAVSWIHDFVLVMGNEATAVQEHLLMGIELHFNVLGYKNNEAETNCSYCIDKVALPENKVARDTSGDRYSNGCAHFSDSTSDPDIPHEVSFISTFESNATSWKCSLEEFEQLKLEKYNMVLDLESTKAQLQGTEQLLAEVKSQLASAQKLNSLAETQLKCMAKSYKSLETRAE